MNIKVVYCSKTGNTKKVASSMAEAALCEAVAIKRARFSVEADLLMLGASLYRGDVHADVKRFIEGLDAAKVRRVAVFCTSVMGDKANMILKSLLGQKGIAVDPESFSCKGKFLWMNPGHPDTDDLSRAKEYAGRMISKK